MRKSNKYGGLDMKMISTFKFVAKLNYIDNF